MAHAAEPSVDQLRREPLPLYGRVAVVTGVSRRAGIGYAVARRRPRWGPACSCRATPRMTVISPGEEIPADLRR